MLAVLLAILAVSTSQAQVCGTPPCGGGGGPGPSPLTITPRYDLQFGRIGADATLPGTATVDPTTSGKFVTGGAFDFGGIHSPASFDVRGDKNAPFTITLPGSVTLSSGTSTMTLNTFTSDPSGVGFLSNGGKATLNVGATLQIGANQPSGTYTGVFAVTVNY